MRLSTPLPFVEGFISELDNGLREYNPDMGLSRKHRYWLVFCLVQSAVKPGEQVSLIERIIEENDLISSRFLPIGGSVSRAVGRITLRQHGRTLGYGTGFLISPELLLTNHHVLETAEIAADSFVEFDFFERQDSFSRRVFG